MPHPKWKHRGVVLGRIVRGVYHIDRTFDGRRFRPSTGKVTPEAALEEFRKFEADPVGYCTQGGARSDWASAIPEFVKYARLDAGTSDRWVRRQAVMLAYWGDHLKSLEFDNAALGAFLQKVTEGKHPGARKTGLKISSRNRYLTTLKAFMKWARKRKLTKNFADSETKVVKEPKGSLFPKVVEPARWAAVLKALCPLGNELPPKGACNGPLCPNGINVKGYCFAHYRQMKRDGAVRPLWSDWERWRRAAEVMLGAGLRFGEVVRIRFQDVHPNGIHIPEAKSHRARVVYCSARTIVAARRLVELGGVPDDASSMDKRIAAAAKRAGVERFTCHQLRHTFATDMLRKTQDIKFVQEQLGHADIATTQIYLHAVRLESKTAYVEGPI